jgi:hypothetical protein
MESMLNITRKVAGAQRVRGEPGARRSAAARALLVALMCVGLGPTGASKVTAGGLVEEFAADPFVDAGGGRPVFERRGAPEAFIWEPATPPAFAGDAPGSLLTRYDTLESTARAFAPLSRALGPADDFTVSAVFVIRPEGFFADPFGFAQISFGLMNRGTTGDDRTGDTVDSHADSFDLLEFDYFPNISPFFGGPFTGGSAFGAAAGDDAFGNFSFASVPLDLPLGEPLEAVLAHRAEEGIVEISVARVLQDGSRAPLLAAPAVLRTASLAPGFALDALGIFAWHDGFNIFSGSGRSLRADVEYHRLAVEFEEPIPVEARLLPDPLFVSTRSRFVRARLTPVRPQDANALAALAGEAPAVELWHGGLKLAGALRAGYDPETGTLSVLFDAAEVLAGLGQVRGELELQLRGAVAGADRLFILGTASGSGGNPGRRRRAL